MATTIHQRIIHAVYNDPIIGVTIQARLVDCLKDGMFSLHRIMLSTAIAQNQELIISREDEYLLRIIDELNHNSLINTFSKENIKIENLLQSKTDKFRKELFRPYIEKRIHKIITFCLENDLELFQLISKDYLDNSPLNFEKVSAEVNYSFSWLPTGLTYSLVVKSRDRILQLTKNNSLVLCDKPGIIVHKKTILFIKGLNANKLRPFFKQEEIKIPQKIERKYFNSFIKSMLALRAVKTNGFDVNEFTTPPQIVLIITVDWQNDPVILLRFKYKLYEIDADYEAPRLVKVSDQGHPPVFEVEIRQKEKENLAAMFLLSLGLKEKGPAAFLVNKEKNNNYPSKVLVDFIRKYEKEILSQDMIIRQELDKNYLTKAPDLSINSEYGNDWFDIKIKVRVGDKLIPFIDLHEAIISGSPEYILDDGSVFIIPNEWFSQFSGLFLFGKKTKKGLGLHKMHYLSVARDYYKNDDANNYSPEILIKRIFSPEEKLHLADNSVLRPYQHAGLLWLYGLNREAYGGCLADDMGLGKTLQILSLLDYFRKENNYPIISEEIKTNTIQQLDLFDNQNIVLKKAKINNSLIVVPVSLLTNWENEINKFTPGLTVYRMTGKHRINEPEYLRKYDVILTTYGIIRNDIPSLKNNTFFYLILDESQNIKNPSSITFKAARQIKALNRLVMTGTPVENSLADLWSQMSLVNPGLLGTFGWFKKQFIQTEGNNKNEENAELLKKIIKPFIMRRTKQAVATDLPPLSREIRYCEPSEEQWSEYEECKSEVRNFIIDNLNNSDKSKSNILVLQSITKLRLIANHPVFVKNNYKGESGKTDEILNMIRQLVEGEHKILIFSQFVKHLDMIAENLTAESLSFLKLTGKDSEKTRARTIRRFEEEKEIQIFLISMKAGGVGLNLTVADYVFILDPWWNPAVEEQAISRAHRIGQSNKVIVYRFITRGTIEEKIHNLQLKKQNMADIFINKNVLNILDAGDVINLL